MRPLYIFDIDGTIALIDHRRHILAEVDDPQRWRRYYAACDKDTSNDAVIDPMDSLSLPGAAIWLFSGRSAEVRDKTEAWLAYNTSFMSHDFENILVMRDVGDYTADDVLKRSWYDRMLVEDQQRLVAVFDDRDRVVKMWRDAGVSCFQVANGDF